MNVEDGGLQYMNQPTFVRYLAVKISISGLEMMDHPSEKDIQIHTPQSKEIINKFVEYCISLYNYFHPQPPVTYQRVIEHLQALWWDDVWAARHRKVIVTE